VVLTAWFVAQGESVPKLVKAYPQEPASRESMIKEFGTVALTRDLEGTHLKKGDLGTVVDIFADGNA
jgi:hypothetical protein